MNKHCNTLLDIANSLDAVAKKLRELADNMATETVSVKTPGINSQEDNLSTSEFRQISASYFRLNKELFQKVLASFDAKSLADIDAKVYAEFINAVKVEFKDGVL